MAITWAPALAEALASGLPLQVLGQSARNGPLSRLLVLGRSEAERGAWLAAVLAGTLRTPPAIEARFRTERVRGGVMVFDESGKDRFVVTSGLLNQLVIACGSWPLVLPLIGPKADALPVDKRSELESALDLFCGVVDAATGDELKLVLEPTGVTLESAVSSVGRAAAGLLRPRPGQVYKPPVGDSEDEQATTFADIGGQDAAKAELEMICLAVREPQAFGAWGARPPRGVLLYGPPGTGKTMLARALARESGARFIHVRATDIVSKWYGEAERKLQQAFDWARRERPAVMFFDELDAIARSREDAHEATHRMVSTFLENLDGLAGIEGVIVLGATNRPEAVDEALTRPGRFDRLVEVPLPTPEGRRAIFEVHMNAASRKAGRPLFEEPNAEEWERLLQATAGYSGADIAEAVRRVLEGKIRSGMTSGTVTAEELLVSATGVRRPW
jgi:AAA+ superfamily predicted ATPase